jgi:hypothetical protein
VIAAMNTRILVAVALVTSLVACEDEKLPEVINVGSKPKPTTSGRAPAPKPAAPAESGSAAAPPEPAPSGSAAVAPPADGTLQLDGAVGTAVTLKEAEQVWNNYRIKMRIAEGYEIGENMGHPTITSQDRSAAMILVFDFNGLMPSREMTLNASRVNIEELKLEPEVPVTVGPIHAEGRLRAGTGTLSRGAAKTWAVWFETPGRYTGAHAIIAVRNGSPGQRVDEIAAMLRSIAAL